MKKQPKNESDEINWETRLFMVGLTIIPCIWFVLLVSCIVINIGFSIVGVPSPKSKIGEVINQTKEFLIVELRDEEYVEVDILKRPKDGVYPETKLIWFWSNFLLHDDYNTVLTDDYDIEGDRIKFYTINDDFSAVGQYCENKVGVIKLDYWKCNEITTSVVYYFTNGYMTISLSVISTLICIAFLILLCVEVIICIVVPIGLYSELICNDNSDGVRRMEEIV